MQICEDGYAGLNDPVRELGVDESIVLNTEELDDGSIVVNFDILDEEVDEIVAQNGYIHVRKEDGYFMAVIFDADGDVLSETKIPFNFIDC